MRPELFTVKFLDNRKGFGFCFTNWNLIASVTPLQATGGIVV